MHGSYVPTTLHTGCAAITALRDVSKTSVGCAGSPAMQLWPLLLLPLLLVVVVGCETAHAP